MRPVRRAGLVWAESFASSKKLRELSVRAQARRISITPLFSVLGASSFLRSVMRRGAWRCNAGSR